MPNTNTGTVGIETGLGLIGGKNENPIHPSDFPLDLKFNPTDNQIIPTNLEVKLQALSARIKQAPLSHIKIVKLDPVTGETVKKKVEKNGQLVESKEEEKFEIPLSNLKL